LQEGLYLFDAARGSALGEFGLSHLRRNRPHKKRPEESYDRSASQIQHGKDLHSRLGFPAARNAL